MPVDTLTDIHGEGTETFQVPNELRHEDAPKRD